MSDQTPTLNSLSSEAEIPKLMDALEVAWGIIANGRAWDPAMHDEWEAAKFRFRDEHWHPALDRNLIDKTGGVS